MLPFILGDRCTTVAYFGDEEIENLQRRARDPVTGETYLVGNISYEEWRKQIDNKYGENTLSKYHKMYNNTSSDKEQYNKYKNILGKEKMPSTFAKFQDLKYKNSSEYDNLKSIYNLKKHYNSAISNGSLSPLVDFDLYEKMNEDVKQYVVGLKTNNCKIKHYNNIEIKSYSRHFVDRIFGSIEERRSGVELDDIVDTIKNSNSFRESKRNGSIKIIGEKCIVSINPETGNLIQVNPQ